MKYFSEITNKTYDTIADLVKAERAEEDSYEPNPDRVMAAKEAMEVAAIPVNKMHNAINALWEEYDQKCDEILDADVIKEFVDAFCNYKDILANYIEEHGKVDDTLSDEVQEAIDHATDFMDLFDDDIGDCECEADNCVNCMKSPCDDCKVAEADAANELTDEISMSDLHRIGDGEYFGEGEKDGVKWKMYVKHGSDDKVPSLHDSFSRLLRNIFS